MSTAILVDGGFFIKRYRYIFDKPGNHDPKTVALKLHEMAREHVGKRGQLFRVLYYDCPPLDKKVINPINGEQMDFSRTRAYYFKTQFFEELKRLRKVAVRLGELRDGRTWNLKPHVAKALFNRSKSWEDVTQDDLYYNVQQKGVDMKIALDIASLSYKRLVDQIVLVAGDADFVPAAKLARREGIDFILDPMWNPIKPSLFEHIDGLRSRCQNPDAHRGEKTYENTPDEDDES